jgi:hypothetical protein
MTARLDILVDLALYTLVFLLALGQPALAVGQGEVKDTTSANSVVRDLPLTAAQRQSFVGSYAVTMPSGEETVLRVVEEQGVLKATPENQGETRRLLYQGENVFQAEGVPNFILRFELEAGRATKFTVRKDDGLIKGVRVP